MMLPPMKFHSRRWGRAQGLGCSLEPAALGRGTGRQDRDNDPPGASEDRTRAKGRYRCKGVGRDGPGEEPGRAPGSRRRRQELLGVKGSSVAGQGTIREPGASPPAPGRDIVDPHPENGWRRNRPRPGADGGGGGDALSPSPRVRRGRKVDGRGGRGLLCFSGGVWGIDDNNPSTRALAPSLRSDPHRPRR